jgi:LEA14-like dessication related protein
MQKIWSFFLSIWMVCFFSGCAGMMNSDFDPPVVSLRSFKMLQQESVSPGFEIGLHIINPNRAPLNLKGIYYTVAVEGYDVLAGVANDLPIVEPYGEADIVLLANVDLLRGIKLISSLMQEPRESFKYSFSAKLDVGGFLSNIVVQEEGEFNLR